jgi:hypothetical protein
MFIKHFLIRGSTSEFAVEAVRACAEAPRHRLWARHPHVDFQALRMLATDALRSAKK